MLDFKLLHHPLNIIILIGIIVLFWLAFHAATKSGDATN